MPGIIKQIKSVSFLALVSLSSTLLGCDPNVYSQYNSGYGSDPYGYSNYPPPSYPAPNRYDRPYDYYPPPERHRCGYGGYDRDRRPNYDNYDSRPKPENRPAYLPPPPTPTPAPEPVVKPSCPAGTTFNGRHCIVPEDKRRPGGKGTVNACPKGMWLSGDRCVKN